MSSPDKDKIKLQRKVNAAKYLDTAASFANIAGNIIPGVGVLGGVVGEVANHLDPQVRQSNLEEELDKRDRDKQSQLEEQLEKRFRANRASRKEHIEEALDKRLNKELDKRISEEIERKLSLPCLGSPMAVPTTNVAPYMVGASLYGTSLPSQPVMPLIQQVPVASHHLMLAQTMSAGANGLCQMYSPSDSMALYGQHLIGQPPFASGPLVGPKQPLRRLQPLHAQQDQQLLGMQEHPQPTTKDGEKRSVAEEQEKKQENKEQPQHPARKEAQQLPAKQELPSEQEHHEQGHEQDEPQQQHKHAHLPVGGNEQLTPLHQSNPEVELKIAAKDPGTESTSSISSSDGPQQWSSTDKSSCIQLSQSNLRALMKGYGSGSVRSNRLIPASGKVHKFNAFVTMTKTIQQFYLICCEK